MSGAVRPCPSRLRQNPAAATRVAYVAGDAAGGAGGTRQASDPRIRGLAGDSCWPLRGDTCLAATEASKCVGYPV
jgi:hypothetical protein